MDLGMWRYHRARYDSSSATLQAYAPKLLKDPVLNAALLQIELAELAITARMAQLDPDAEDA